MVQDKKLEIVYLRPLDLSIDEARGSQCHCDATANSGSQAGEA